MQLPSIALSFGVLLAACAAQQPPDKQAPPRSAKILKDEVDRLIHAVREAQRPDGALGDGSCRQTAMVLAAAGSSHRFYHEGDGPWIRKALLAIFAHRRGDGSFSDGPQDDATLTSRWVLAALEAMDPERHAAELTAVRKLLAGEARSPLAARAAAIQGEADPAPDRVAAIGQIARRALDGLPQAPDAAAAATALAELVACQVAAREDPLTDKEPEAAVAVKPWSEQQQKGLDFLLAQQEGGVFAASFGGQRFPDVGLTGIGQAALQTKPTALRTPAERAAIDQGLAWLSTQQDETGAIGQQNVNYATCASMMALAAANDPRYAAALHKARRFVLALQNIESRGYGPGDRDFGSIGYGGDERGDLSNVQFAVDALRQSGLDAQHEAFAKAIVFLQRTQNLRSVNDFKARTRSEEDGSWHDVAPGDDGGAAYYPGNSPAGYLELPDGTRIPRSYGSMTYALLKAYILCGLPAGDPRVQAAVGWIQSHWRLDVNPGHDPKLGVKAQHEGLYYGYMVMAQALDLAGVDQLETRQETSAGVKTESVDWRRALRAHLLALQRGDGSWVNAHNGRWWEDQPLVCTVYVLLALERCSR